MHRIHHSVLADETNSNFGFNLSVWDRVFKTYKKNPENGHDKMELGTSKYKEPEDLGFLWLLVMPVLSRTIKK